MEQQLAILMADLTGYTAMTDVHGGASAAKIVKQYMSIVDASLHGNARVVQRIGDQVVMIAEQALDLCKTADKINVLTREESNFLSIHAGLHYGPIFIENGNLFGSTINVAARIMNIASRGQILCSSTFLSQIPYGYTHSFVSMGLHKLKNVITDLELFEMLGAAETMTQIDPVCHMHLDSSKQNLHVEHHGKTYHFCGEHCLSLFMDDPGRFV